jgi:hypothetical protein
MKQNWIAFGATVAAAGLGIAYWRLLATWTRFSASIGLNILLGMLHSDTRLPGYGPSAFGGFDHALTRDLEIATYRALDRLDPIEPHFTYSLAGSLMRCLAFDEAESLYAALIGRDPPFEAARLTLAMLDWQRGRKGEDRRFRSGVDRGRGKALDHVGIACDDAAAYARTTCAKHLPLEKQCRESREARGLASKVRSRREALLS